jgi:hypothetical protein
MEEHEPIAMLLIMRRNKWPKHGSVFGREVIHCEQMGQPLEWKLL